MWKLASTNSAFLAQTALPFIYQQGLKKKITAILSFPPASHLWVLFWGSRPIFLHKGSPLPLPGGLWCCAAALLLPHWCFASCWGRSLSPQCAPHPHVLLFPFQELPLNSVQLQASGLDISFPSQTSSEITFVDTRETLHAKLFEMTKRWPQVHWKCRLSKSVKQKLITMPRLTGKPFGCFVSVTPNCTEQMSPFRPKFPQQLLKDLEVLRSVWVSSHVILSHTIHFYRLTVFQCQKCYIAYVLTQGSGNHSWPAWASWTFWPGTERAHRATCLLPPSLGHGGRKQAGSRLRLGPTFPTRWREPPSENGGRCTLLIKAFSKFPSSPCEEGAGSGSRAIAAPSHPPEQGLRGLGMDTDKGAKSEPVFKHLSFYTEVVSWFPTPRLARPVPWKLQTLRVHTANRKWKLPM